MAQYKVPQDVEADDKLLGPFNFRQFVYLLIDGGLIAMAVGLFQIFPLLALIPVPFILFFGALALPLRKDQPMETYLAAIVSYYIKPRTRRWMTGQPEVTITITAPKKNESEIERTRNITGEEATHRLSFLADIVDTEGYAIKGIGPKRMDEDLIMEANTTNDMFETNHFDSLENTIAKDENAKREKVMREMRAAIEENERIEGVDVQKKEENNEELVLGNVSNGKEKGGDLVNNSIPNLNAGAKSVEKSEPVLNSKVEAEPVEKPEPVLNPKAGAEPVEKSEPVLNPKVGAEPVEKSEPVQKKASESLQEKADSSIMDLANNTDDTIATISKEANSIKERDKGEVFISLH